MTDDTLAAQVTELMDREKIRDCIYRYCRGIDRADEETLRSSYWPDAYDSHGTYVGDIEGFYDWVKSIWKTGPRNIHAVSNVLIDFRGPNHAAVESYFTALQRGTGPDGVTRQVLLAGRYCDHFEKRGAEWRVLERKVVFDWVEPQTPPEGAEEERFGTRLPVGGPAPDDPIYHIKAGG
ncbi:gamma-BHC dehydrochlorinase [Pseudooceanicola batsensis HTCC2597]|uniref:Gamma-BHC dehydrochlorinase n=1 Tax=Pseudooceanicola batsensis (strain ATCC BAA-863 / DSM 15984 / KCTC 12145 / HTCC2597) TaxID=252305 RepID=A3U147_PSEBH|nr:nuclear transport factor 2 family protein [Pseudooceanicola batsensis]EAQ02030.1 gamma-BHC dehydrochlorinase [Pseudooceanicola batsensis HTCC2597]